MLGDMIGWSERTVRPPGGDFQEFYNEQGTTGAAWADGFFFGNTELSLELWNVIAGVSGFDE